MSRLLLYVDDTPRIFNGLALMLGLAVLYAVGSAISNASRKQRHNKNKQEDTHN